MPKVGLIQYTCTDDMAGNIAGLSAMIRNLAGQGAEFILTPECSDLMTSNADKLDRALAEDQHPTLVAMKDLASELEVWLQIGSLAIKDGDKLRNRSYMISDQGQVIATYDKIHLYDAMPGDGHTYRESDIYISGDKAMLAQIPVATIGMTICYDLRFAALYRHLAKAGAQILTVPAAFSVPTGQAHWEALMRARAIETGCFVMAAGQTGAHRKSLHTYGHSMIINPWGEIIAKLGDDLGVLIADIDLNLIEETRHKLPSLQHDRAFTG